MAITDTAHDSTKITRFFGLSTDIKPPSAMIDAEFHETDTGDDYVFTGTAWVRSARVVVQQAVLGAAAAAQEVAIAVQADRRVITILEELLGEQKITNAHLALVTGEELGDADISAEVA